MPGSALTSGQARHRVARRSQTPCFDRGRAGRSSLPNATYSLIPTTYFLLPTPSLRLPSLIAYPFPAP